MKKTLKFLSWMFILLFTVSLSSCKDDDEDARVEWFGGYVARRL